MHIAAFGDAHLGFKQYGFDEREQDFLHALWNVMTSCQNHGSIKTVINTGDLFNNSKPQGELVYQVKMSFMPFSVLGIDGNHDIADGNWLRLCDATPIHKNVVTVSRHPLRALAIAGLNWVRPAMFMQTLDEYLATLAPGTKIDIFVIHQLLDEFVPYKSNQISGVAIAEKLKPFGVRMVLMGDLHETTDMELSGIKFVYTGSTEVNSISEKYDKSFVILDIPENDDSPITFQRYPIDTRPLIHKFIQSEKDLDELLVEFMHTAPESRQPFLMIEYDIEGIELAARAETVLKDKALFRLIPVIKGVRKDLVEQMSSEGFERTDAMGYLKKSITAFFEPNTEEYQLILQLLEMPDEVDRTITTYGKQKGLL